MPRRNSIIVDEIMRDYYRKKRWEEKIAEKKRKEAEVKHEQAKN